MRHAFDLDGGCRHALPARAGAARMDSAHCRQAASRPSSPGRARSSRVRSPVRRPVRQFSHAARCTAPGAGRQVPVATGAGAPGHRGCAPLPSWSSQACVAAHRDAGRPAPLPLQGLLGHGPPVASTACTSAPARASARPASRARRCRAPAAPRARPAPPCRARCRAAPTVPRNRKRGASAASPPGPRARPPLSSAPPSAAPAGAITARAARRCHAAPVPRRWRA